MPKKIIQNNEPAEQELKLAYWLATNKPLFKKIGKILFLIFDTVLILYVLYNFIDFLFIGGPREQKAIESLLQETVNTSFIHSQLSARPLEIRSVFVLKSQETYDSAAFIKNNNADWAAKFRYQFTIGGSLKTGEKEGFILPGESKFITDLGFKPPQGRALSASPQGKFAILDVVWERVPAHEIEDYKQWSEQRLNFKITETNFSPAATFAQGTVSRASFKVENATAFNYWNVGFRIILYRGAAIAGLNYVTAAEFKTGEIREMQSTWIENIGQVTKIEVQPEIYILDDSVFMR